jgi:DNA-binding MarR family transcriptional regulator
LVRREHDEKDLRRSLVLLTPQGQELLDQLVTEHLSELAPKSEHLIQALRRLQTPQNTVEEPVPAGVS